MFGRTTVGAAMAALTAFAALGAGTTSTAQAAEPVQPAETIQQHLCPIFGGDGYARITFNKATASRCYDGSGTLNANDGFGQPLVDKFTPARIAAT